MKVTATARPFLMTINGNTYTISSYETQVVLDMGAFVVSSATRQRVVLVVPENPSSEVVLTPATLGGGPAFVIERTKAVR